MESNTNMMYGLEVIDKNTNKVLQSGTYETLEEAKGLYEDLINHNRKFYTDNNESLVLSFYWLNEDGSINEGSKYPHIIFNK